MPFRASSRGSYGPQGQRAMRGPLAPVWVTTSLPGVNQGVAYSQQLNATDDSGVAPTYTLATGSIPTGLTLSSSGLISGTPSASGTFTFTVRATDENGRFTDSGSLSIVVTQPGWSQLTLTTTTTGRTGPTSTGQVTVSGLVGTSPTYSVSEGYIFLTIPVTGTYRITAAGARSPNNAGISSGLGATMRGDFSLSSGNTLCILIGQQGQPASNTVNEGSGGGGGTFVTLGTSRGSASALIVAGGGGGATATYQGSFAGEGGITGNNGTGAGAEGSYTGSAGAGFESNSSSAQSFRNGGVGGQSNYSGNGGFGGAGASIHHPGGGGGGYSGGAGGYNFSTAGRGGGSFNNGSNQSNTAGNNNGAGYVTLQRL